MAEIQRNYADGFDGDGYLNHEASTLGADDFRDADKKAKAPRINGGALLKGPSLDSDISAVTLHDASLVAIGAAQGGFREVVVKHGKEQDTVYVAVD